MRQLARPTILLVTMTALVWSLAACSGSGSIGGGSSASGTRTYTNDQYGYSITYDRKLTEGTPISSSASSSAVMKIAFVDSGGAKVNGNYVNGLLVSVYKLARDVKPGEVAKLKQEFGGAVGQMTQPLSDAKVDEPLAFAKVNGTPGFRFGYSYTLSGTPITAVTYFLVKGQLEYQVTAQAAAADWPAVKGKLEAALQTFVAK